MRKTKTEHALAFIKAGLSAIPIFGGSLASLVVDYIPTATQRSIEEALSSLQEKLTILQARIDTEAVNKDEFSELFKSSYLLIQRSHQQKKIDAAVNLIVNILLKKSDPKRLSYTELDHFARCLDLLSIGALEVLEVIVTIYHNPQERKQVFRSEHELQFDSLSKRFSHFQVPLLMGLVAELSSLNLFYMVPAPAVRTADYGNQVIELTPLGERFVTHLLQVAL
ncbi:MAG: hypothetical protein NTV89_04015 [Proteobacteria bacterium]|nr:hypothetical protein [Pseudomonadota bacterium]